jgi:tRNA-dihydrouridine synthase
MHIPIFGNGDIDSPQKALEYKNKYGVDGIMIGRASIGYPWIFRDIKSFLTNGIIPSPPDIEERVEVARKHLIKSIEWKGEKLGIVEMRRHYTNYFRDLPGVKEYRSKLVTVLDSPSVFSILDEMKEHYQETSMIY